MRRFAIGLMLVMCLILPGQADAFWADPLGLISSAVIQPYVSSGSFTVVELTSPVFWNIPIEGFWFDAFCFRLISFPRPLTRNDITLFSPEEYGVLGDGLLVLAYSFNNQQLRPIPPNTPIHSRGHWVNIALDYIRVIDPIAVSSPESVPAPSYSPLRSAASWTNPQVPVDTAVPFDNAIWFVCPSGVVPGDAIGVYEALPATLGFPAPPAVVNQLFLRVFEDELFVFDRIINCFCFFPFNLGDSSFPYTRAPRPHDGSLQALWYTEVAAIPFPYGEGPRPGFTGYRQLTVTSTPFGSFMPSGDQFSRLNNASTEAYLFQGEEPENQR
jgi:hypothetical protein